MREIEKGEEEGRDRRRGKVISKF
jgi:hypothetical protein